MSASEILKNVFPWYATGLFLRVCEAGGLSAASQSGRAGVSQPALLKRLDAATRTRLVLREAPAHDLAGLVRDDEVDLAISLLSRFSPPGSAPLVGKLGQLPLVLHVPPLHLVVWHGESPDPPVVGLLKLIRGHVAALLA